VISSGGGRDYHLGGVREERLRERVRGLSEAEAAETLRLLDARQDPLSQRLDDAPVEDEEISRRRKKPRPGGPRRARRRR
jgi:hypothetical protein